MMCLTQTAYYYYVLWIACLPARPVRLLRLHINRIWPGRVLLYLFTMIIIGLLDGTLMKVSVIIANYPMVFLFSFNFQYDYAFFSIGAD